MRFIFSLVLLLLLPFTIIGQAVHTLHPSSSPERVSDKFVYFLDESNETDFEKVLKTGNFKPAGKDVPNFNVTKGTVWAFAKFTADTEADWYMSLDPGSFNQFTFYRKNNRGNWSESILGNIMPKENRDVQVSHFLMKTHIHPGDTTYLLLKVQDYYPISFDIKAAPLETLVAHFHAFDTYNVLCFGIMVMMLIYNLYLFVTNKNRVYLYYVLYVFFNVVFTAVLSGYSFHFPRSFILLLYYVPIIPPACFGVFGMLFTLQLFKEALSPRFRKGVYIFISIAIADVILSATPLKHLSQAIIQPLGLLLSFFSITAAIIALRKKHSSAKYYLFGFGAYMLALCYIIFAALDIVPINAFAWCILITGSVVEAIMLSFALGDKFKLAQVERERAQMESLRQAMENERLVKEQNAILERKVKARTIELEEQKEQIEHQKELLEEKQKEILDSIQYARHIQTALLPPEKAIERMLKRAAAKNEKV